MARRGKQYINRDFFHKYFSSSKDPEFIAMKRLLAHMKQQCFNPSDSCYEHYGARGIKVCDRWLEPQGKGFENFVCDMGIRPSSKHSIDRIDVNGDYSPENCRWADKYQQMSNTTTNNSFVGVQKFQRGWRATINFKGKAYRKLFKRKSEAISQRLCWEKQFGINIARKRG